MYWLLIQKLEITISDTYIIYEENTIEVLSNQAQFAAAEKLAKASHNLKLSDCPQSSRLRICFRETVFVRR